MVLGLFQFEILRSEEYGRNVIIFGADLSNSTHANNKTRSILVLGKDFIQGKTIQQFMKKKCIQLILLLIIKDFV